MSDTQNMIPTGGNNHVTLPSGLLDQAMALDAPAAVTPPVEAPAIADAPAPKQELSTFEVALKNNQIKHDGEAKVDQTVTDQSQTPQLTQEQILELPDEAKIRVKLDGKEEVVAVKDYKDGIQREALWTKRMQQLAQQRKQAEQEIVQQYALLQQQAMAIEAAKAVLGNQPQRTTTETVQQPQLRPDELATLGDVNKTVEQRFAELQAQHQKQLLELQNNFQQALVTTQHQTAQARESEKFTAALKQVMSEKDFQVLSKVVPNPEYAEAIIRHNVANMDSQSMDEAIQNMRVFVKGWTDGVKALSLTEQKQQAAAQARAQLEPSVGSPPAPQRPAQHQTIFRKDGSVNWAGISQRAHEIAAQLEA